MLSFSKMIVISLREAAAETTKRFGYGDESSMYNYLLESLTDHDSDYIKVYTPEDEEELTDMPLELEYFFDAVMKTTGLAWDTAFILSIN